MHGSTSNVRKTEDNQNIDGLNYTLSMRLGKYLFGSFALL